MTRIDQFESLFKAADKPVFHLQEPDLSSVLLVSDRDEQGTAELAGRLQTWLSVLGPGQRWQSVAGEGSRDLGALLARFDAAEPPDLVITWRHLHSDGWRWPYSLGEHVDVLTQATSVPVLVLPRPEELELDAIGSVMVVTDHLAGDETLVNTALRLLPDGGDLHLTHVEDEAALDRFLELVARIPEIDTDTARELVKRQAMKEPADYVESIKAALQQARPGLRIHPHVTLGHQLSDHVRLVREHTVDLLVMNTKDDDQAAMHGLAHPLAVELRDLPLLML